METLTAQQIFDLVYELQQFDGSLGRVMSRLFLFAVFGLLTIASAKGSSLSCATQMGNTRSAVAADCVPALQAHQGELYNLVIRDIPSSTFSWLEAGRLLPASAGRKEASWLLGFLLILTVVMGSVIRMLMSDRVEKFLEELFEPMNWTSTNHG